MGYFMLAKRMQRISSGHPPDDTENVERIFSPEVFLLRDPSGGMSAWRRRGKKKERKWSPESLAKDNSDENENAPPEPEKNPDKRKKRTHTKEIPMRIGRKSFLILLKKLYGSVLFPGDKSSGSLAEEYINETENGPGTERCLPDGREVTVCKEIPLRAAEKTLAVLLEEMYGYAIMSTMIRLFNKLEWKTREAVAERRQGE